MRVLFISSFLIFPDSRVGGAKRLYYLAAELARRCELTVICTDGGREAPPHGSFNALEQPFERLLYVPYKRVLADKLCGPLRIRRSLEPFAAKVTEFVGNQPFDAVICAFPHSLSFLDLPVLRTASNITYIEDDLWPEVMRERIRTEPRLLKKAAMAVRLIQGELFYRAYMPRVRCFVSISAEEQAVIKRKFPSLATRLVGYGLPLEEYPPAGDPPKRLTLGFIGNYMHRPNLDAMVFFLKEWYPEIKERIPGIAMHIAGKNIPESLIESYRADTSIVWKENVRSVHEFYSNISILINPIVSQRGLRTKVVEAAAFCRPVISSALGAEGLADLRIYLAESAADVVKACESLGDAGTYRECAAYNREVVERHYSVEAVGEAFIECAGLGRAEPCSVPAT